MITYELKTDSKTPLYEQLYRFIKEDILSGKLVSGEKLPSKRSLAAHLGISTITIENSYAQLVDEGYIYSKEKSGFYVSDVTGLYRLEKKPGRNDMLRSSLEQEPDLIISSAIGTLSEERTHIQKLPESSDSITNNSEVSKEYCTSSPTGAEKTVSGCDVANIADFSGTGSDREGFPFSVWAKMMRETISEKSEKLMEKSEGRGIPELRYAIAKQLYEYRGMNVDPGCIVIGAGTEYLYSLLIQLLGRDKCYCVEDPGYKTIEKVYRLNNVIPVHAGLDDDGILVNSRQPLSLSETPAQIVHISPTHQFPTGITMPVTRRYELLNWAAEKAGRYIIEDDYDSEFRLAGRPIPSLQSIDSEGRVIYINTFSKSLASTIRISYMVLPEKLNRLFEEKLGFLSCTVSNFEQYALAKFMSEGHFEKHINRRRLYYSRKREELLRAFRQSPLSGKSTIIERELGPHFLLRFETALSDRELQNKLKKRGIIMIPLSEYYADPGKSPDSHEFIMNYTGPCMRGIGEVLNIISDCLSG